ncbi:hypothetical protein PCASD_12906 [Puccinia coronata f. sp. avenae]|uniref:Uncharacterized protein n=1 Tax=Puccinia coronata f. sp. avenae TaxID=200324 RepID=A0A2N5U5P2_9BASI|nr:hypothetical protein PCASD_12906 [Puccinia coronata f. sp. avenae]
MPKTPTLQEIQSMPYHALQAEAAKHAIRRNLGANKLREALKLLLGSNPDPSGIPQQWFIAAAKPGPTNPKPAAVPAARPTKTNARITAAQNKLPQKQAPRPPPRATRARTQGPPVAAAPPSAAPQSASQAPPQAIPGRPSPTASGTTRPSPVPSPRPLHAPPAPRPLAPLASTSRLTQGPTRVSSSGLVAKLIKVINTAPDTIHHAAVPPSEYLNPLSTPETQQLPDALRREARRLGLTRNLPTPDIDFLCYLIRDALMELNSSHFISCIFRASKTPIEKTPWPFPPSPNHPVHTTSFNNAGFARSPVNPSIPWNPSAPTQSPPHTQAAHPTRPQPRQAPTASPSLASSAQPGQAASTRPPASNPPSPQRVSMRPASPQRLVSTPPSGMLNPPVLRSPNVPQIPGRANNATQISPPRSLGSLGPGRLHRLRAEAVATQAAAATEVFDHDFSDDSEDEAMSRRFVESMLLGCDPSFLEELAVPVTPSRRKRNAIESPVSAPNKKAKHTQFPAAPSGTTSGAAADVPMTSAGSSSPSDDSLPVKPMKLFPSAKKAPAALQAPPLPSSSPMGPPSQPTLYGTEQHYGNTTGSRFGEALRGFDSLLPSPFRKSKARADHP